MNIDFKAVEALEGELEPAMLERIHRAADRIVEAKQRGGRVAVVTGSGPNVHEGVTTLIAELIRLGVVDGVTTSSAVISHEMGGVLDKVRRVDGRALGIDSAFIPRGGTFELTVMDEETLAGVEAEMAVDKDLMRRIVETPGDVIIKAAGNLGYPMGLRIERIATEILSLARMRGVPFEEVAGGGADPRTMIGAGAKYGAPVLVTIPQLVGGGAVGLAIGDSISITERAARLARMLDGADVIVESAVALTQEIHDGPFEMHTGHGLWSAWQGHPTYSLEGKTLIRIDLDPALEMVWQAEQNRSAVQEAIDKGLPKTKLFKVPFRMEMSGFARLEGSIAVTGDIGAVWPILARRVTERLGLELEFMSYPQQTPQGKAMREWIVENVRPIDRKRMLDALAAKYER
ncbi:MAG: hypothetical protein QG656_1929 [Candidatus Hydrogenedentes bacterium]|nr:hypothetical protein [Candidatus Hydrogenedentota bacterium]